MEKRPQIIPNSLIKLGKSPRVSKLITLGTFSMPFSTSPILKVGDPKSMMDRIDALAKKNADETTALGQDLNFLKAKEGLATYMAKLMKGEKKNEEIKVAGNKHLEGFGPYLSPEAKNEIAKIKSDDERMAEKLHQNLEEATTPIRVINLIRVSRGLDDKSYDKRESIIHKDMEQNISNKVPGETLYDGYYEDRALRSKQRNESKEEREKVYTEGQERYSPIHHVVEQMQSDEPGFGDGDE